MIDSIGYFSISGLHCLVLHVELKNGPYLEWVFIQATFRFGPFMDNPQKNSDNLDEFERYIAERKPALKRQYEKLLAYDLSRQQSQGCFQRNVLAVLEQFYDDALRQLKSLPFDASQCVVNNGMSDLTRQVLGTFYGSVNEFLLFVIDKHRTSCALSNFPDEHKPDKAYVDTVKRDIAELWRNFALNINAHFLECRWL